MKNGFRLVTLDLDHTLFMGNSVLFLNRILGISEELDKFHADYRDGKISERELNIRQAPILQKFSLAKSYAELARGPILKRLDKGVKLLQDTGFEVQMLSLNPFQLFFTRKFGIGSDVSLSFDLNGSDFLGRIKEIPEDKLEFLEKYCSEKGIELENCAHVGDSRNDIATFRTVGYSVALNCSDSVVFEEADVSLDTHDFMDVANTILKANDLV
ncbi:MAG: HAD hydrolase family protein [Nitrososphaerota archaeon]|nr:HAD hydrolase family protein [Nitrososphaerota archaeon]